MARPSLEGSLPPVAITQDYLNQRGGSERVVLELTRVFPQAPTYTLAYWPEACYPEFREREIHTSRLPAVRNLAVFRALAPAYPLAFRAFPRFEHELVVSSSAGWSHQVRVSRTTFQVVYWHTVTEWVHEPVAYFRSVPGRALARPLAGALRALDVRAAARADLFLANGNRTRERIRRYYGRDADVIFPPVEIERFSPRPRGDRLLVVSRLFDYKRIDLAIEAANRSGIGLDIIGDGPSRARLREMAGPTVTFHGSIEDAAVTALMEQCSALCLPAVEDFGISPVEANAAGKPVVALAAGGVLETQEDGVTAALFHEASVESLLEAIRRAGEIDTPPEDIAARADRFSGARFRERFAAAVERARSERPAL